MDYGTIVGRIDLAQVALYLFWAFFAALIFYIQRENMREGYPLVDEEGNDTPNQGIFPVPSPKTFLMPGDRPDITVPDLSERDRAVALERINAFTGTAFEPTGDPLADGVGPASWASRDDTPEIDAHGHAKIQPMAKLDEFFVAKGQRDPRGADVIGADGRVAGTVKDMWIDVPEQMIRYYEIDLGDAGSRLVPKDLSKLKRDGLHIVSLPSTMMADVPTTKAPDVVTKLEEEKISAYWCGGKLYSMNRIEPIG
ncbi:MAG: photosynthetic reaction center subunit H [Rubricella sp.]